MTQRSLLISLGLASSISFLGSGLAHAEGSAEGEAIAVPSAEELLSIPAPTAPAPAPVAAPAPAPIEAPIAQPERSAPEPAASAPAPVAPSPEAPVVEASPEAPVRPTVDYGELYIDPTDYGIGATERDRPTVVLTERSSGCETALQPGQDLSGICRAIQTRQQQAVASGAQGSGSNGQPVLVGGSAQGRSFAITPASVQNFYNRTIRPLAFLGNGNTSLLYPLSIPASITSAFGWRIHPISGDHRFHAGTDIGAPMGTPVLAAFSGRVNTADFLRGYGLTVILTHGEGRSQTLYAHLSELFVQPGEVVEQGDVIGRVGSTGNSTGPHLHFEYHEYTSEGWVAMDAGQVLQNALAQMFNGFQIAKLPMPQLVDFDLTLEVKDLADFGKLAADVLPEVSVAAEKTFTPAAAEASTKQLSQEAKVVEAEVDDLPEVVVPAVIHP